MMRVIIVLLFSFPFIRMKGSTPEKSILFSLLHQDLMSLSQF